MISIYLKVYLIIVNTTKYVKASIANTNKTDKPISPINIPKFTVYTTSHILGL